jgi:hypothetical protein
MQVLNASAMNARCSGNVSGERSWICDLTDIDSRDMSRGILRWRDGFWYYLRVNLLGL